MPDPSKHPVKEQLCQRTDNVSNNNSQDHRPEIPHKPGQCSNDRTDIVQHHKERDANAHNDAGRKPILIRKFGKLHKSLPRKFSIDKPLRNEL